MYHLYLNKAGEKLFLKDKSILFLQSCKCLHLVQKFVSFFFRIPVNCATMGQLVRNYLNAFNKKRVIE